MQAVIEWKYIETDGLPPEPSPFDEWCPKYLVATVETGIEVMEFADAMWFDSFGNQTSFTVYAWAEVNVPKYPTPGYRCPHCHADVTKEVDRAKNTADDLNNYGVDEFGCPKCKELVRVSFKRVVAVEAAE